jgi:hypothetical protein
VQVVLAAQEIYQPYIYFASSATNVQAGQCVTVYWNTANVKEVYYNGAPESGIYQSRQECPLQTTTYTLRVVKHDGTEENRQIVIDISGVWTPPPAQPNPPGTFIEFSADKLLIRPGSASPSVGERPT